MLTLLHRNQPPKPITRVHRHPRQLRHENHTGSRPSLHTHHPSREIALLVLVTPKQEDLWFPSREISLTSFPASIPFATAPCLTPEHRRSP